MWFDMIASGVKKEEYRTISQYWLKRLIPFDEAPNEVKTIVFHRAYTNTIVEVEYKALRIRKSRPEWSENGISNTCFVIKLGNVIKTENWIPVDVSFDAEAAKAKFIERMTIKFRKIRLRNEVPVITIQL
jgi:hypothetical protein